ADVPSAGHDPDPRDGRRSSAGPGERVFPRRTVALSRGPWCPRRGGIPQPTGNAGTLDRPLGDGPGPEGSAGGPVRRVTGAGGGATQDRRPGAPGRAGAPVRGRPRSGPGAAPRRSGRSGRPGHGTRGALRVPEPHGPHLLLRLLRPDPRPTGFLQGRRGRVPHHALLPRATGILGLPVRAAVL